MCAIDIFNKRSENKNTKMSQHKSKKMNGEKKKKKLVSTDILWRKWKCDSFSFYGLNGRERKKKKTDSTWDNVTHSKELRERESPYFVICPKWLASARERRNHVQVKLAHYDAKKKTKKKKKKKKRKTWPNLRRWPQGTTTTRQHT